MDAEGNTGSPGLEIVARNRDSIAVPANKAIHQPLPGKRARTSTYNNGSACNSESEVGKDVHT